MRVHGLEDGIRESVRGSTALSDREVAMREESPTDDQLVAEGNRAKDYCRRPPAPVTSLDALDRQLRETEMRHARRTSTSDRN